MQTHFHHRDLPFSRRSRYSLQNFSSSLACRAHGAKLSRHFTQHMVTVGAVTLLISQPACAIGPETPQIFSKNCAGCHAGGGNVVQRNAGLTLKELERNNAATSDQIYQLIYAGKGKMPGYGTNCAPKGKCTFLARLPDNQIQDLTDYVLEKAGSGW